MEPCSPDPRPDTNAALRQIARVLGTAADAFLEPQPGDLSQTVELLRAWHKLTDPRDRATVMDFVRTIETRAQSRTAAT